MGWNWPFGSNSNKTSAIDTVGRSQVDISSPAHAESARTSAGNQNGSNARSREEQADAELDALIKTFSSTPEASQSSAPIPPKAAVAAITPPIAQKQGLDALADGRRVFPDGTIDISPDTLHPRTMSCRQAFDQAFYCQSLGGKFNDIYRYGQFQSCSEQWNAFWLCMRTRTLSDDEKARQFTEYYQKRDETRKKEHGSSEDIWELRLRSVEKAFWKDPDEVGREIGLKE